MRINNQALKECFSQYKASFKEFVHEELYKWEAVKCFQDNWNPDAADFAGMLKSALAKTGNLLASKNFFPRDVLEELSEKFPEDLRGLFQELFDNNNDVVERGKGFEDGAVKLMGLMPEMKNPYQNPNSISTYLWLRYPDMYYIYKYSIAKLIAEKLGAGDLPAGKYDRMLFSFELYDAIKEELEKDEELIKMSRGSLTEGCYIDDSLNTLVIDVCYFMSDATKGKAENEDGEENESDRGNKENDGAIGKSGGGIEDNDDAPEEEGEDVQETGMEKNTILYGPPGTGKTYSTVLYAVAIIENKPVDTVKREAEEDGGYKRVLSRYKKYKDDGLIAFTTFHQSFGYEEFIEGIRPVVDQGGAPAAGADIKYEIRDGLFKAFCDKAGVPRPGGEGGESGGLGLNKNPRVWKVSLEGAGDNETRTECLENGHIRIGWDMYGEDIPEDNDYSEHGGARILNAFYNNMQVGDIVMSCYSARTVDAIGVIAGEPEWDDGYPAYKRLRKVDWLAKGINEDIVDMNAGKTMAQGAVYMLGVSATDVVRMVKRLAPRLFKATAKIPNRVFIIDEINRGNISKVFGELITLIEKTKRIGASEESRAELPYSGQRFGVPSNVYIIGTMNTADRSIALIDTALRRRFEFIEMQPEPGLLEGVFVEDVSISEMLGTLNRRITVLLDREHTIGHSYLLPLKKNPTIERMASIFEKKILPLLQEYFYDDYEKIQLVLGDNQKDDDSIRFIVKRNDAGSLFGSKADIDQPEYYEINREALDRIEAYAWLK